MAKFLRTPFSWNNSGGCFHPYPRLEFEKKIFCVKWETACLYLVCIKTELYSTGNKKLLRKHQTSFTSTLRSDSVMTGECNQTYMF